MAPRGREPGGRTSEGDSLRALADAAKLDTRPDSREHARLLQAAGAGSTSAQEALMRNHLGWVVEAAEQRVDRGLAASDLFQEGSIGLVAAIQNFAASGHTDFEAFAREQVALQMETALAEQSAIEEQGRRLVQAAEDYERAEVSVRRAQGRSATNAELAQKLEWSERRTEEIGALVYEARRRHDEELLEYLHAEAVDEAEGGAGPGRHPGQRGPAIEDEGFGSDRAHGA